MYSSKLTGAFYTPEYVARSVVKWAIKSKDEQILDPACGRGVFLIEALKHLWTLAPLETRQANLSGVDIDPNACNITKQLLESHGLKNPWICNKDFIDFYLMHRKRKIFDVIIGNPPFIRYQLIKPDRLRVVKQLIAELGVALTAELNLSLAFLLLGANLLTSSGRLCLLMPRQILFANYAKAAIDFLGRFFAQTEIITVNESLFSDTKEKVCIIRCSRGGMRQGVSVKEMSLPHALQSDPVRIRESTLVPLLATDFQMSGAQGATMMHGIKRCDVTGTSAVLEDSLTGNELFETALEFSPLIAARLTSRERKDLSRIFTSNKFQGMNQVAQLKLGIVTGNKRYFILSRQDLKKWNLKKIFSTHVINSPRYIKGLFFTKKDLNDLEYSNKPCLLLNLNKTVKDKSVEHYIRYGQIIGVNKAFKCRIRDPWYHLGCNKSPDAFLGYLTHLVPKLAVNKSLALNTNNVHGLFFRQHLHDIKETLCCIFYNYWSLLSIELIGRTYSMGVLKIEPGDFSRILIPSPFIYLPEDFIYCIDSLLRKGRYKEAIDCVSRIVANRLNLSLRDFNLARQVYYKLQTLRTIRAPLASSPANLPIF